jgi:N-acetylhexosamine 1-kinase
VALRAAIDALRFDGAVTSSAPLPGGHIHQSFLITCTGGRYVLQRLNDRVFVDVDAVLSNVERLVAHLAATGRVGPELVETRDGALSLRAADGSTWRAFRYLEGTVGRAVASCPTDAFEAARAFSKYLVALVSLPGPPLLDTIAPFHDLSDRLSQLGAAAGADLVGRRSGVGPEIDRAHRLGHLVLDALSTVDDGAPVRHVHNDAKLSNVRFDATTGSATCVIDLDTSMAGLARHDVGELVRTIATHAPEDAIDLSVVDFDLDRVEALAAGYFAGHPGLERSEVDSLSLAGPEMAVENALRFLTDHLSGDRYFAVEHPQQNLDRCRCQLRLTELMLESGTESAACFARTATSDRPLRPRGTGETQES